LAAGERTVAHAVGMGRARGVRAVPQHEKVGDASAHVHRVDGSGQRGGRVLVDVADGELLGSTLGGFAATMACDTGGVGHGFPFGSWWSSVRKPLTTSRG